MKTYSHSTFDDLIGLPNTRYVSASRKLDEPIQLRGLKISDMPDDFVVLHGARTGYSAGIIWNDRWLAPAVHYMPNKWESALWLPGKVNVNLTGTNLDIHASSVDKYIDEPAMFIDTFVGSRNFGHTVHDTLPYGLLFRRARSMFPGLKPIVNKLKFEKQRQIFSYVFGINYSDCIIIDQPTEFKTLILARRQTVFNSSQGAPNNEWATSFSGLRYAQQLLSENLNLVSQAAYPISKRSLNLYLHRFSNISELEKKGILQGRNFTNEHDLILAAMRLGLVALEPGFLDIQALSYIMTSARVVVGVHGAQLANAIFCAPGTKFIELRSFGGNWRSLEAVAAVLGFYYLEIRQPKPQASSAPQIDVERTIATISNATSI